MAIRARSLALTVSGLSLAALAGGCSGVQNVVPVGAGAVQLATERPHFTDADEERMAQANAQAFEDSVQMWDDPLLETYVTEIGQRLVAVAHPRPFEYRFRVVKDPAVNAFTFGGGLVYVYAGLIARMENEAELAMVLGHEIAHVTEGHIPKGIESSFNLQMLGALTSAAASETGVLQGQALDEAYKYTLTAAINGHGRAQENQADEVGLEYMVKAGYDPRQAPRTFQVLYKEYGDPPPIVTFFYGNHPSNVSRYERTSELVKTKYAAAAAESQRVVNTEEFKRRTRELVVATGILDYQAKRFKTAQAMFEKAAPVWDGDPVPHYYLGKIALETGGDAVLDTAVAELNDAVKADSTYAPAYHELGLAYYRKKAWPKAVAALQKYLTLAPNADDAARVQTMIAELKRY